MKGRKSRSMSFRAKKVLKLRMFSGCNRCSRVGPKRRRLRRRSGFCVVFGNPAGLLVPMLNPCGPRVGSLYVHVPFCAQKCAYCAFYSEASSGELINRYVAALLRELELVARDLRPQTVFFGGGTPSL